MARDLHDKTIIITGASSGIGRATAIACARAGMHVAISARRDDKLREVGREIETLGRQALVAVGDVCSPLDQEHLVREAKEKLGRIDAVFANAGYGVESPGGEMTDEALRKIFEVNFFGTMNTIRATLPTLREQKAGHIFICSSCLARIPLPYYGAYSATKSAQHHMGRAMSLELQPEGINVTTVHPVATRTEFFDIVDQRTRADGFGGLSHSAPKWATQPAEKVANAIVRCLRKPRPEIWMSRVVQLGGAVMTMLPGVADMTLRGQAKRSQAKDPGAE